MCDDPGAASLRDIGGHVAQSVKGSDSKPVCRGGQSKRILGMGV